MYEIKITDEFCGAHKLRGYKGECEALHGHNWKTEISVYSKTTGKNGMVMDFKILKDRLKGVLSSIDHKYLNDLAYFKKKNPTSENIAEFIHKNLSRYIKQKIKVSVWETATSCASFEK
ncbi:MAG: 6-carboxytetrahydropterin synthase QueD [Candidatus Omnitrophica bacterium]|nr:6-carboxytetrahydropterin synthase QueD [Candidatus Omnitrophota bacterium]